MSKEQFINVTIRTFAIIAVLLSILIWVYNFYSLNIFDSQISYKLHLSSLLLTIMVAVAVALRRAGE
jgi:hypothetical protein